MQCRNIKAAVVVQSYSFRVVLIPLFSLLYFAFDCHICPLLPQEDTEQGSAMSNRPLRNAPGVPLSYDSSPHYFAGYADPASNYSASTPRPQQIVNSDPDGSTSNEEFSLASPSALGSTSNNANAVQVGILRGRLQGLQHESATAKRDVKDLTDKLTVTSTKLNEQKVQNSALMHKYSAAVAKLSATEQSEKQLEETLLGERRNHQNTRDAAEKLREQIEEQEAAINALRQQVAAKPPVDPTLVAAIKDRNQYIPTREVVEKETISRREKETLVSQMTTALDRLILGQEEDETALFVCRSAVLSAATDLESKLAHTENVVDTLSKHMTQYARELEEETSRMMLSLINENKELWTHVTKMRYDLDRANSELAAKQKKQQDSIPKDQHEYAVKQISLLEEKLKRAQQTVERQTVTERDIEDKMKELMQSLSTAKQRVDILEADLSGAQQAVREKESDLDACILSGNQKSQEIAELQTLQLHQASQIRSLSEQLHIVQESYEVEGRQQLKQVQNERDEALDNLVRLRSDFEDALHRLASLEKELDNRTAYFNTYKISIEEQHTSYARALQEELLHNRQIFERECDDLRREVAERTTELHTISRELDEERAERHSLKSASRTSDEEINRLRSELSSAQALLSKADERIKKTTLDWESAKAENQSLELKQQGHQQEVQRLLSNITQLEEVVTNERERHTIHTAAIEADWKESDRSRQAMQEEVKRLRSRIGEADQLKALKERMERDKEQLMTENVRLHQQYQEVQQQNVQLQHMITQLKNKAGGNQQVIAQMEELQRRLQELPSLRGAADEARREALRAKEETEVLRQERDEMSARLEFFLEETRSAAKKDTDLDRLFRDATSQVRRLDQQIEEATQRSGLNSSSQYSSRVNFAANVTGSSGSSPTQRRSPVRPWRN